MINEQTLNQTLLDFRQRLSGLYPKGEVDGFVRIACYNILHYESVDILLHKDSVLPDFIVDKFHKVVDELLKKRPIQYIFRNAYFHGHRFEVNEATLIPRPETEELVDMIVDENRESDLRVLDGGTGSGCIAVSLALALKFADVTAIDLSDAALAVAERNAEALKAKVTFRRQDMLRLTPCGERYDIIVSNPPYIADSEKADMDKNVLAYEPHMALFVPDSDPLRFYRALAVYGTWTLVPGGRLYFEINSRFPAEMTRLLEGMGYTDVEIRKDMQRMPRFAVAKWNKEN